MSNFQLGIFNDLAGYLTAAYTECGPSVNAIEPGKAYSRYFLQKYYKPRYHGSRDDDVAPQFTNAVVKLAKNLRNFDLSVGSSPTLKQLLTDAANKYVDGLNLTVSGTSINNLVNAFNSLNSLGTATLINGQNINLTLNNEAVKKVVDELKKVVTNSRLLEADKDNARNCLNGQGTKAGSRTDNCVKLLADDTVISLGPFTETSQGVYDLDKCLADALKQVKESLRGSIDKWTKSNYDSSGLTVTGDKSDMAKVALTVLKNNSLSETELALFNEFCDVMRKNGDMWELSSPSDIDLNNLKDYRINLKMVDSPNGRVPMLVSLLPLLEPKNNVAYNDGSRSVSGSDKELLRKVFTLAYSSGDVNSLLPGFDDNASTSLRPDLEAMLREILMKDTTPEAHIDDNDSDGIAKVLARWRRVGKDTWEHLLDDGTAVTIKAGTPAFDEEVSREVSNCAAIGFPTKPEECATFLRSVALNNTEELAKVALSIETDVAPQVVANLHPKFALAILKAFGFHRKMCKDRVAGRQIEKVQRADEWLEKFVDKKFKDNADKIRRETKLVNFLDLLAQLVNANPSVLNDNMVTETEESRGEVVVPECLAQRKITAVKSVGKGKPCLSWTDIQNNMNKVYGSFSRGLTFDGLNTNSPFGMDNLFPQMSLLTSAPVVRGSTWGAMVGGTMSTKVFTQDHQTALEYSRNIHEIIEELLANLKSSGKDLSPSELEAIARKKGQFEMLERELFSIAWDIQRYSQLLKVVETEKREEIITYAHIKKYVEKYNSLLERYEKTGNSFNTLISLLKDCCDGGDGDKSDCKTL